LERPTKGDVRIEERVVNELPPGDLKMAMAFQDFALYPHFSLYGNIAFALKPTVKSRADLDRWVRTAAAILGLGPLLAKRPRAVRRRAAAGRPGARARARARRLLDGRAAVH